MTTEAERTGACPTPEQIAALAERRLTEVDRAAVEAHLADCDECRELYADLAEVLDDEEVPLPRPLDVHVPEGPEVVPWWKRRKLQAAAGGVLALAASLVVVAQVRPDLNPFHRPTPYEELVAAVGANRTVEGRLTGGFTHGPLRSPTRSASQSKIADYDVLAAVAKIQRRAANDSTAENLHALGAALLIVGERDRSIAALAEAVKVGPQEASYHCDLAAAYFERASNGDRDEDYSQALDAVERGLEIDPASPECLFNRALILHGLGLIGEAHKAWDAYLRLDSSSGWAAEAKRRRERESVPGESSVIRDDLLGSAEARARASTRRPRAAREFFEETYLRDWVVARLANPADTSPISLAPAKEVAHILAAAGDRTLLDQVEDAIRLDARQQLVRFASQYELFAEARRLYEANEIRTADALFVRLADANDPIRLWSALYRGIASYYAGRYDEADATVAAVLEEAERRSYKSIAGRARWMLGLSSMVRGRFDRALHEYGQAQALFEAVGDRENSAAVSNLLAEVFVYLGQQHDAWRLRRRAWEALDGVAPRRLHTALIGAAVGALRQGQTRTAFQLADVAVTRATLVRDPALQLEGRIHRARAASRSNRPDVAHADFSHARELLATLSDPTLSRRFTAEVHATAAYLAEAAPDRRWITLVDEAISFFEESKATLRLARLFFARARILCAHAESDECRDDLQRSIALFEQETSRLPSTEQIRLSYLDQTWPAYGDLIQLSARRGDFDTALRLAERSRSAFGVTGRPVPFPTDVETVSFSVTDNLVVRWHVVGSSINPSVIPISRRELEEQVSAFRDALRTARVRDVQTMGARLGRELLTGVGPGPEPLLVVPDDVLFGLPFAALISADGKHLVEHRPVLLAPRVPRTRHGLRRHGAALSVLAVGNPALPSSTYARLEAAEEEAQKIGRLFSDAVVATGRAATWAAVRDSWGSVDVIHFAGHATLNDEFPLLSRLEFASASPDATESRSLYAWQVRQLRLDRDPAVFLAACSSLGSSFRGVGLSGLARAFLDAGAATVIATHWDVEDGPTRDLVSRFYEQFTSGESVAHSLAIAMRLEIKSSPTNYEWAAVTALIR